MLDIEEMNSLLDSRRMYYTLAEPKSVRLRRIAPANAGGVILLIALCMQYQRGTICQALIIRWVLRCFGGITVVRIRRICYARSARLEEGLADGMLAL